MTDYSDGLRPPHRPLTAAQRHGIAKYAYSRRMLRENAVELTKPALRELVAEGGHYLCVAGDRNVLATDGYPIDAWPIHVKPKNYRHHASHSERMSPDLWYDVLTMRGWKPHHSGDNRLFILAIRTGPGSREIQQLTQHPFDPDHPLLSLRQRRFGGE